MLYTVFFGCVWYILYSIIAVNPIKQSTILYIFCEFFHGKTCQFSNQIAYKNTSHLHTFVTVGTQKSHILFFYFKAVAFRRSFIGFNGCINLVFIFKPIGDGFLYDAVYFLQLHSRMSGFRLL